MSKISDMVESDLTPTNQSLQSTVCTLAPWPAFGNASLLAAACAAACVAATFAAIFAGARNGNGGGRAFWRGGGGTRRGGGCGFGLVSRVWFHLLCFLFVVLFFGSTAAHVKLRYEIQNVP